MNRFILLLLIPTVPLIWGLAHIMSCFHSNFTAPTLEYWWGGWLVSWRRNAL